MDSLSLFLLRLEFVNRLRCRLRGSTVRSVRERERAENLCHAHMCTLIQCALVVGVAVFHSDLNFLDKAVTQFVPVLFFSSCLRPLCAVQLLLLSLF